MTVAKEFFYNVLDGAVVIRTNEVIMFYDLSYRSVEPHLWKMTWYV